MYVWLKCISYGFLICDTSISIHPLPCALLCTHSELYWPIKAHFSHQKLIIAQSHIILSKKLCCHTYSQAIFSMIQRTLQKLLARGGGGSGSQRRGRDWDRAKANWGVRRCTLNNSACSLTWWRWGGWGHTADWLHVWGCCGLCVEMFWLLFQAAKSFQPPVCVL